MSWMHFILSSCAYHVPCTAVLTTGFIILLPIPIIFFSVLGASCCRLFRLLSQSSLSQSGSDKDATLLWHSLLDCPFFSLLHPSSPSPPFTASPLLYLPLHMGEGAWTEDDGEGARGKRDTQGNEFAELENPGNRIGQSGAEYGGPFR